MAFKSSVNSTASDSVVWLPLSAAAFGIASILGPFLLFWMCFIAILRFAKMDIGKGFQRNVAAVANCIWQTIFE